MDEADDDVKSASDRIEYGTAQKNSIPFGAELQMDKHRRSKAEAVYSPG